MAKKILFTLLSILMAGLSFGQTIDSLKLADMEIPAGYTKSDNPLCVTPHAISFYNQTALYESFLGKVVKREFQSFNKKVIAVLSCILNLTERLRGKHF